MRLTAPCFGLLLLTSLACVAHRSTSYKPSSAVLTSSNEPAWVTRNSAARVDFASTHLPQEILPNPHQVQQSSPVVVRLFEGVGRVAGIANEQLARTTAANRARAEVARLIEAYTYDLWQAYAASPAFAQLASDTSLHIEIYRDPLKQAVRTFGTSILLDLPIDAYFQIPDDHQFFALARLELITLVDYLVTIPELPHSLVDFIRHNAPRVHEELGAQE